MPTLRSHRRTITAMLAAFALVLQALLPHVHAWQSSGHGVALTSMPCGHGEPPAVAKHDADHERAACPTCQALAHNRQITAAPRAVALAYVPLRAGAPIAGVLAPASNDRVAPSAPRAPPFSV